MLGVLQGFATIGIVIGTGAWLAHRGIVDLSAQQLLARLAFTVGLPALLITMLADADASAMASRSTVVTASAIAVVALAYAVPARLIWRRRLGHVVMGAQDASYVNSANLGIPIAAFVLGDPALVAPVLLIQVLVMQPIALMLLDHDAATGPARPGRTLLDALTNPITLGTAIGVALSLTGTQLPVFLDAPARLLGGLAIPAMLIAYGISLRLGPGLAGGEQRSELIYTSALKLLAQPAVAWAAGLALGLTGPDLFAVVVIAALPTAQNIFIFALQYDRAVSLTRDTILVTTIGSVPVIVLAAALLG